MIGSSKDLLDLELTTNATSSTSSSLESKLLVCKKSQFLNSRTAVPGPDKKPPFSSLPKSQVLGKVKDFLGVISEANEKLQLEAKANSEKYDIEVLKGDESEYIEMDLMLGVADLQTPEAIAAAESALAGHEPVLSLAGSSSESESEDCRDSSNDSDDEAAEEAATSSPDKEGKRHKPAEDDLSSNTLKDTSSRKRAKIIELA